MCKECYVDNPRITPVRNPEQCLSEHTQYICGTCGRCICIEADEKRGLRRWNFPFSSLELAKLYVRAADATMKASCGIYELEDDKGRVFYKIFATRQDLESYLRQHKKKRCNDREPKFEVVPYIEYPHTQIRKVTVEERIRYCEEKERK